MKLNVQIYSFLYSYFFGVVFYFLLKINYKFSNKFNIVFNYVISFLFILAMSLLYFIILLKINNGYIHLYFYLCILFGYLTMYFIFKKWFT